MNSRVQPRTHIKYMYYNVYINKHEDSIRKNLCTKTLGTIHMKRVWISIHTSDMYSILYYTSVPTYT